MKVLMYGGSGMLGSDCKEVLSKDFQVFAPTRKELDITKWDHVIEHLHLNSPDIVLNCAGFTDVDACEKEELEFLVRKVNVEGPRNLAQGSARFNCRLIHVSSDYVFSGQKTIPQPYFEDDPADPISAYGKSKMESETAIRENASDYLIIRTGWLYGINGKNFIKSVLSNTLGNKRETIKVVDDQVGSPTWTYRVALQIKALMKSSAKGTYHATSEGYCSRFEYAKYLFKKLKLKVAVKSCSSKSYPQMARRPLNCILENRLLKKFGNNIMPEWKADVDLFLDQYGQELVQLARAGKL
ncbi:MAG: dTDP-4-dehydrorhamnose reductase [Pseudomonadota bacterium]